MKYNRIERWKDIANFNGDYQVSNLGNIKSFKRKISFLKKLIKNTQNGYYYVMLYKNSNHKNIPIHRLVAQTFIKNTNNLPQVNHKDGNKDNNYHKNLKWCTHPFNMKHCYRTGLRNAEHENLTKLSQYQVKKIRKLKGKFSQNEIAKMFGVKQTCIWKILNKESWKYI